MSFFQNCNTDLYYETHGQGQPLLIIPGGADGRDYLSIVDVLKEHFNIILPGPRGSGREEFDMFFSTSTGYLALSSKL